MATPIPVFPDAIATDEDLKVANNRIQTTLRKAVEAGTGYLFVQSAKGFVPNCLVTIGSEIISIASVQDGPCPTLVVADCGRGFDGTRAFAHCEGARVTMLIGAWHHNALATEIKAIEEFLGPNGENLQLPDALPFALSSKFDFKALSPPGSLVIGSNTVPMSPMPRGIVPGGYLCIQSTSGMEAVLVTQVSNGSVSIDSSTGHPLGWIIHSATGGIQEAIGSFAQQGGTVLVDRNCTLCANVTDLGRHSVMVTRLPRTVITANNFTILKGVPSNFSRQQTWMNAPNFDTLKTLHSGIQFDMGGFPDAHMYEFTTGPAVQALVGSVVCTGTTTLESQNPIPMIAGVAGYSETYVVAQSSVGVMGMGQVNGHNQFAWGANVMCGNGGHDDDLSGSWIYGLEVDANLWAAQPPLGVTGIAVAGNMATKPAGSTAVWVSLNPNTYKWDRAYHTEDGATNIAVDVGTAEEPNVYPSMSQAIFLSSRTADNLRVVNDIFVDQYGDLQLSTGRYIGGAQQTRGAVVINIQASSGGAPGSVLFPDTGGFYIKATTFANLPAAVFQGTVMTISDGSVNTPGQAAAGGGSYFVAVMWNGTNWVVL